MKKEFIESTNKEVFYSFAILEAKEKNLKVNNNQPNKSNSKVTNNNTKSNHSIIYVPEVSDKEKLLQLSVNTGDTENNEFVFDSDNYALFPLFFQDVNKIMVPKKVQTALERYVPKNLLRLVDGNPNIAIEKCLLFLSYLASTYYNEETKWKKLNSEVMTEELGDNYRRIIDVLLVGTKDKGAIIEINEFYCAGNSRKYKIADTYLKVGLTEYEIQNEEIINKRRKSISKKLVDATNNSICKNLFHTYTVIDLPTKEEMIAEAKKLIKEGYKTKKGKILTLQNKHPKDYWKDSDKRSFVEDNIELFYFLTKRGYMVPVIGNENSGGRVTDSFTLMPSWIRNMCKINGERIEEADFSALHPNIAMKIYGGKSEFITHETVAKSLNIDIKIAKKEHLSFFNKEWSSLYHSPVYPYYYEKEKEMMQNMYNDKECNGYKITSKRMFALEVQIMTRAIEILNYNGIYVGYVYDALFCEKKDKEIVKIVMNDVAKEFGIKTTAK